ncbi:MAG: hypothetical protein D6769_00285 [Methanobacteriota archaeon]|nr:MAG: hypothetical protein D6769_00285 [Euryarchaeota archaeon]
MESILLDVDYTYEDEKNIMVLHLKEGKKRVIKAMEYMPYFLVGDISKEELENAIDLLGREVPELKIEGKVERFFGDKKKELWKVVVDTPQNVPKVKHVLKHMIEGRASFYEFDIPFKKRFLMDHKLDPLGKVKYNEKNNITSIQGAGEGEVELIAGAFDIEVYNPEGIPREERDPIIIITYKDNEKEYFISTKGKGKNVVNVKDEKELLEKFDSIIKESNPDVLLGYNSSQFDFPYIEGRVKKLHVDMELIERRRKIRKGLVNGYKLRNNIHLDLYPAVRLLTTMGAINVQRLTLKDVYKAMFGEEKLMVDRAEMWKLWDEDDDELLDYALGDARATYRIGEEVLPLEMEIARTSKTTLFDASLSTAGQLVESRLMYYAALEKHIIPPKPKENEVKQRLENPIEGAFVKLPEPGIYDNIAVLDFRGLYPSIIISYNIDPYTLTDGEGYESPSGYKFRKDYRGLVPRVLEELLVTRAAIKKEIKKEKDKEKLKRLKARSQALKILANSFYGYLGYARSRWYSRECAESVTAWGRAHIKSAIDKAKEDGFDVLYADTDSLFLLMGKKSKEDVLKFLNKINESLPEKMELELENFYTRAVFVSKKSKTEKRGAKKKYAMLAEDGSIKIRGFELVRRDWSEIAREIQKKVLESILKDGRKEKAIAIVRDAIKRIKEGKESLDKFAISTQLNKKIENYEAIGPEVVAAKRLRDSGMPVGKGTLIRYVITKEGKSISDKAYPLSMAKNYDPDYYIKNQILPAVMKILKELSVDEEELLTGTKQQGLKGFF